MLDKTLFLLIVKLCMFRVFFLGIIIGSLFSVNVQATVVTSIRPLGFIAAAVADGVMPVEVVLPDGASPHDYSLRPLDVKRIKKADVFIWVGPEMEAFLTDLVLSLPAARQITLAHLPSIMPILIKGVNKSYKNNKNDCSIGCIRIQNSRCFGKYDMHLWLSPIIARHVAEAIHASLINLMPEKKQKLNDNLQIFNNILTKNDKDITTMLLLIRTKGYYVFHDAYGYFEKYYGLTPLGYFTINPEIQPGAKALYKIRTLLIKQKVTCIFSEPQFRPAIINAIIRGTNVHVGTLDPLGSGIALNKESYTRFLLKLSRQYVSCLEKTHEGSY